MVNGASMCSVATPREKQKEKYQSVSSADALQNTPTRRASEETKSGVLPRSERRHSKAKQKCQSVSFADALQNTTKKYAALVTLVAPTPHPLHGRC